MRTFLTTGNILTVAVCTALSGPVMAESMEELQRQVAEQEERLEELNGKLESLADSMESTEPSKTSMGGYGELHYNNIDGEDAKIDFHRFVIFFGHQFTDDVRFYSELEVEHALSGDGKKGEVEIEQAFVEWNFASEQHAKAGVFLIPVGILNETHEPDTFYGVERNNVEKNVIPSTWWEAGAAVGGGVTNGFNYDVALHSGLNIDTESGKYKIRDGRQKVSKAVAEDLAMTGRLKYTGVLGLELAATLQYQQDINQSAPMELSAWLYQAHAAYQYKGFGLRALYAYWDIDESMNTIKAGAAEQSGWYIEPSYKLTDSLGVFVRYSAWDNQADASPDTEFNQADIGLNYWLTDTVVFKVDYQDQDVPSGKDKKGFNLGMGYSF